MASSKRTFATVPELDRATAPPIPKNSKEVTWCLATDVRWRTSELESRLPAVERIPSEGHDRPVQFIPYRFEFANKLGKEHKLLLAFDALLLSGALGLEVNLGKIVHGDSHATLKVKIPVFASEVTKRIKEITSLLAGNSPPDLVLNRHCGRCEFKTRCSAQAGEKDELSLLSGISEKDRQRLHSKGIFGGHVIRRNFFDRRFEKMLVAVLETRESQAISMAQLDFSCLRPSTGDSKGTEFTSRITESKQRLRIPY